MNINNLLDKLINTKNFKEYAHAYATHPSPSPYYKSIMLLYLLNTNTQEYYKYLQSITVEEAKTEEIKFIINLDLLINTCNIKKIKEIRAKEEIQYFINMVINKTQENEKKEEEYKEDEEYYKDSIKNCMSIIKN
ncbi:uncharacterized protein VNE69_08012 [Vairimorpha necatrix]|uniref:Uncharacterized protein n=1 Tax=Vairimorpha necatrix TaxID=6039 RepID=A0AAX4JEA2_9MICR